MYRSLLIIAILLGSISLVFSQGENTINSEKYFSHQCDAHLFHDKKTNEDPEYRIANESLQQLYIETMQRLRQNIDTRGVRAATVYNVPLVIHVMHLPSTEVGQNENISMATIEQGVSDLNDAFRNIGPYIGNGHNPNVPSVDVEIEFCLATIDPNGNPTNGVNRIPTTLSNLFRDDVSTNTTCFGDQDGELKELSLWDPNSYMNIWLVNEICKLSANGSGSSNCGVAGYAYLAGAHGACYDGIVNEARYFGSSSTGSTVHIHEVGHYLDLRHTWGTGSSPTCTNNDCLSDGDGVCDTPPDFSTSSAHDCGDAINTCSTDEDDTSLNNPFRPVGMGGIGDQDDNYENFMDYSRNSCQNTYTQGQKDKMRTALTGVRSSLLSSTGCDIAATNIAYFFDGGTAASEGNATTNSGCRNYYDFNIEVRLYKAATANTTVNFSIDASSTASNGADIELNNTSVSFGVEESSKNLSVRVYNDADIESLEIGIINIVSVTGDATTGSFNQTHRVSISDNDNAPSGERPVIFSDDFENGNSGWSNSWFGGDNTNWWEYGANGCASFGESVYISNDDGTTNNYSPLVSNSIFFRQIDASGYTDLEMTFDYAAGGDGINNYGKYIRRPGSTGLFFTSSTRYFNEPCASPASATVDLSSHSLDNSIFDIGFVWYSNTDPVANPGFTIDNIEITAASTDIETVMTSTATEYLGPNSDVYFLSGNGKLIARIQNLSDHDYGCTTVIVETDGTSSFSGGVGTAFETYDFVDKTISVTPTTNNPSGSYEITLYYSETEISGWETASGDLRGSLNMLKSDVSISTADTPNSNPAGSPILSTFTTDTNYGFTGQFFTGFSTFGLTNVPPSLLPVELTNFYGEKENNKSHLYWVTETEINNDYFIIEHSSNGFDYNEVGIVKGAGNSTSKINYDFLHDNPTMGTNYYRLIQIDIDGDSKSYGPIQLTFKNDKFIKISPIPTQSNNINITYESSDAGKANWEIIDYQGRIAAIGKFNLQKGFNSFSLQDYQLSNGVYFIRFTKDNNTQSQRFIIIN